MASAKAGQSIDYRSGTPDVLRDESRRYEVVCALEVVEHVPDGPAFLRLLSALVRPGGLLVISTIDRTLLSWLVAIVGGETILGVLPKGTHRWDWFVRPQEAQRILGREGMVPLDLRGMWYEPLLHRVGWTRRTCVNWAGAWRKPARSVRSSRPPRIAKRVRQALLAIGFARRPNRQPDLVISEDPEQRYAL